MHKLDRCAVPVPNCLVDSTGRRYGDLHGSEKEEIRSSLLAMQGQRCAYCERRTGTGPKDGHVEHFRNQANHKTLDLDWKNMFWSCNDENTCGKHKDKCDRPTGPQARFDREVLIDPCEDDPERFLMFLVDGTVRPLDGLGVGDHRRGEETLRVFQLAASPYLRKSREDAVRPYIGIMDTLRAAGPDIFVAFVQGELRKLDTSPFATAIKQFLEGMISQ